MKKLLTSLLALTSALTLVSTDAQAQENEKYEFVMESAHAELSQVRGNIYQLKIPTKDVHSVLAFTPRPHRKTLQLEPSRFWDAVSHGNNSFIKNPPNLVVTWSEKYHAASYELTQYHVDQQWITMQLKSYEKVSQSSTQSGRVSLYIDDAEQDCRDWLASQGYDG